MISLTEREREVLQLLATDTAFSVSKISKQLSVSEVTIRNHLNSLAEKGFIVRTHGGAFPAFHESILERQKSEVEEKHKIAQAAAKLVGDTDRIMISAGTTTSVLMKNLLGKCDVHVVTNSTLLLPYVRVNPAIRVTFVAGEFIPSAEAIVGPLAIGVVSQFHVKKAFVGADGFSLENGATAQLAGVAEVVRKMSEQAEETVLLLDSSKYGKKGFAQMMPVEQVDTIITGAQVSDEDKAALEAKQVKLIQV